MRNQTAFLYRFLDAALVESLQRKQQMLDLILPSSTAASVKSSNEDRPTGDFVCPRGVCHLLSHRHSRKVGVGSLDHKRGPGLPAPNWIQPGGLNVERHSYSGRQRRECGPYMPSAKSAPQHACHVACRTSSSPRTHHDDIMGALTFQTLSLPHSESFRRHDCSFLCSVSALLC